MTNKFKYTGYNNIYIDTYPINGDKILNSDGTPLDNYPLVSLPLDNPPPQTVIGMYLDQNKQNSHTCMTTARQ